MKIQVLSILRDTFEVREIQVLKIAKCEEKIEIQQMILAKTFFVAKMISANYEYHALKMSVMLPFSLVKQHSHN